MLLDAYQNKLDIVVFWRLDRFSCQGTLATLQHGAFSLVRLFIPVPGRIRFPPTPSSW
jgi:hypothetical protein